jgi:hypothetical protein
MLSDEEKDAFVSFRQFEIFAIVGVTLHAHDWTSRGTAFV